MASLTANANHNENRQPSADRSVNNRGECGTPTPSIQCSLTEDALMCGVTLVNRSAAESEPDFLGRPWLDAPDEWLSPQARDEDEADKAGDDEDEEDEEDEDLEDEDFDEEDFDDEDFDDEDFDDEGLDDLDEDLDDLEEDEDLDEDEDEDEEEDDLADED